MNKDDLDRILKGAKVPDRTDDYWNEFPARVIRGLQSGSPSVSRARPSPWRLGGALAAAAALGLVIGFALWHRRQPQGDDYASLRDGRVLREMQTQYPGRLQAVIQDQNGLHTQLSEVADVPMSDPVLLEIRDGRDHRVVVTFSGQLVRCGGKNVMVLSDAAGQVMLVGEGFFWSRQASAGLSQALKIQAERLPADRSHPKPNPIL
jgi:hypothetical protein